MYTFATMEKIFYSVEDIEKEFLRISDYYSKRALIMIRLATSAQSRISFFGKAMKQTVAT